MASRKRRVPGAADATGLRQGLANYGDAGFSLFLRKAFIKAGGYSDDALDRPIVGITDTYSDFNPCHGNVPQLIEAVKGKQVDNTDGIKVFEPEGWVQVLPDPDEPVFHVYAEGASLEDSQALEEKYRAMLDGFVSANV